MFQKQATGWICPEGRSLPAAASGHGSAYTATRVRVCGEPPAVGTGCRGKLLGSGEVPGSSDPSATLARHGVWSLLADGFLPASSQRPCHSPGPRLFQGRLSRGRDRSTSESKREPGSQPLSTMKTKQAAAMFPNILWQLEGHSAHSTWDLVVRGTHDTIWPRNIHL